jgi:hypothetical protein
VQLAVRFLTFNARLELPGWSAAKLPKAKSSYIGKIKINFRFALSRYPLASLLSSNIGGELLQEELRLNAQAGLEFISV